jgi:hypothetical protein
MNSVRAIHGHFVRHKNKYTHLKAFWDVVVGTTETTKRRLHEKILFETLNAGGVLYNSCGCLSVCCTLCFCCLDVRYGNIPTKLNTIILLSRTVRCFLLHAKTFLDTGLLRFDRTATGSNNHAGVSGPLLVIQPRFNISCYLPLLSNALFLRGSLPSHSYFFLHCVRGPAILMDSFRVLVFDFQDKGIKVKNNITTS